MLPGRPASPRIRDVCTSAPVDEWTSATGDHIVVQRPSRRYLLGIDRFSSDVAGHDAALRNGAHGDDGDSLPR